MDRSSTRSLESLEQDGVGLHTIGGILSDRNGEDSGSGLDDTWPANAPFDKARARQANSLDQPRIVYICGPRPPDEDAYEQEMEASARNCARDGARAVFVVLAAIEPLKKRERIGAGTLLTIKTQAKTYRETGVAGRAATAGRIFSRLWPHLREADEIVCAEKPGLLVHLTILIAGKHYRLFGSEPKAAGAV
jgi:hypothetical protein